MCIKTTSQNFVTIPAKKYSIIAGQNAKKTHFFAFKEILPSINGNILTNRCPKKSFKHRRTIILGMIKRSSYYFSIGKN
jgi:hypothetical protein